MKKFLTTLMTLALVLSLSLSVFAAGGFVSSPSANNSPMLVNAVMNDCDGELIVTPYSQRESLEDDARALLEKAYDEIASNKDLSKLCPGLKDLGVDVKGLAVSDLFDIGYKGCDNHEGHSFTATLKPDVLDNFVALMCYVDGEWIIVEDVTVDGEYLTVNSKYYGPYAIVLGTGDADTEGPDTGDNLVWIYVVMLVVSAAGLVSLAVIFKKKAA